MCSVCVGGGGVVVCVCEREIPLSSPRHSAALFPNFCMKII